MALIVGLGNPGPAYRWTRHNTGALVVQALAAQAGIRIAGRVGPARVGEGRIGRRAVVLAVPTTFMNLSGEAVAVLLRRWPVPPAGVLIVCDDVALPFGTLRLRASGSDGGHHGLQSVAAAVGSAAFPRLRVGIGSPEQPGALERFVLDRWTRAERAQLSTVIETAAAACALWVREGLAAAMNHYNRKVC